MYGVADAAFLVWGFHQQTLIIHELGFNQNFYTFTVIVLIKIVMFSKLPSTKFINYKSFDMRSLMEGRRSGVGHLAATARWPARSSHSKMHKIVA